MTKIPSEADLLLRQRAEEKLNSSEKAILETLSHQEIQQLLYELRVHRIELEMQNEEMSGCRHERLYH